MAAPQPQLLPAQAFKLAEHAGMGQVLTAPAGACWLVTLHAHVAAVGVHPCRCTHADAPTHACPCRGFITLAVSRGNGLVAMHPYIWYLCRLLPAADRTIIYRFAARCPVPCASWYLFAAVALASAQASVIAYHCSSCCVCLCGSILIARAGIRLVGAHQVATC